jgi:hypothetical protein
MSGVVVVAAVEGALDAVNGALDAGELPGICPTGADAGVAEALGASIARGVGAYFSTVCNSTSASFGAGTSPFSREE